MTDRRLADVSHTPPHRTRNPVQRRYRRGPDVVPDGGAFDPDRAHGREPDEDETPAERVEADETDEPTDERTLKDVDHTPPDGEGVNHVYRRGSRDE